MISILDVMLRRSVEKPKGTHNHNLWVPLLTELLG